MNFTEGMARDFISEFQPRHTSRALQKCFFAKQTQFAPICLASAAPAHSESTIFGPFPPLFWLTQVEIWLAQIEVFPLPDEMLGFLARPPGLHVALNQAPTPNCVYGK